jgi:hypothetical protein
MERPAESPPAAAGAAASHEETGRRLSESLSLPYAPLLAHPPPYEARRLLSFECASSWGVMPVSFDPAANRLTLAVHDAAQMEKIRRILLFFLYGHAVDFSAAPREEIEQAFARHFGQNLEGPRRWGLRPLFSTSPGSRPKRGRGDGVKGSLRDMSFADLVQISAADGKRMEIALTREGHNGCVCLEDGCVVHAAVDETEGEAAFYAVMQWTDGEFLARRTDSFPKRTMKASVMSLLMEGARRRDEGA